MKFSNSYTFNFGGSISGLKEKLQKLLGMESAKTSITLEGEMSCELTVEEMKELISSEDSRIKAFREYIADGRLEHDVVKLVDIVGQAMVEAERIDRTYTTECTNSRIHALQEDERYDNAREELSKKRNDARRKAAKEAAEKESEE